MREPDEHLRTASDGALFDGERRDPERTPVEGVGGDDLDNIQYGSFVDANRDMRLPVTVGVASILTIVLCGWAWTAVGRDDFLATVALVIPMVIALGAILMVTQRQPPRLGIQISPTEVMLGNWPKRTYRFPRSAVTKVKMSNGPWVASSTVVLPSHDFRRQLHSYLQITLRSGDVFCVAADPNNNPVSDHILRELKRTAAPSVLELQPAGSDAPAPNKTPSGQMSKDQSKRVPKSSLPAGNLAAPSSAEKLWESASVKHGEILVAYLPYETDPLILMRYPALTDITHPATAGFHEAMEEATALRTETMPSDAKFAAEYRDAVRRLAVAWASAERAAKREGTAYLDPIDRRRLDQAAKLLRHAEGAGTTPERAIYLQQVKAIMDELVDNGAIHAPPKVLEAIETATRHAIEAAAQR